MHEVQGFKLKGISSHRHQPPIGSHSPPGAYVPNGGDERTLKKPSHTVGTAAAVLPDVGPLPWTADAAGFGYIAMLGPGMTTEGAFFTRRLLHR